MKYKVMLFMLAGLLLILTLPSLSQEQVAVTPITFTDDAVPICDVNDALGPDVVPECGEQEMAFCTALGCPEFSFVDRGAVTGDLNGEIAFCANLGAPGANDFIPGSGCLQIIESENGSEWRGVATVTLQPMHGAFGDLFVRANDGSTIRATLTQFGASFLSHGILIRMPTEAP